MTLTGYAGPLRRPPVNEIVVEHVVTCLKSHWERRPETAQRLRGRIERVLNAAEATGHREGANPAAWRRRSSALAGMMEAWAKYCGPGFAATHLARFIHEHEASASQNLDKPLILNGNPSTLSTEHFPRRLIAPNSL